MFASAPKARALGRFNEDVMRERRKFLGSLLINEALLDAVWTGSSIRYDLTDTTRARVRDITREIARKLSQLLWN